MMKLLKPHRQSEQYRTCSECRAVFIKSGDRMTVSLLWQFVFLLLCFVTTYVVDK